MRSAGGHVAGCGWFDDDAKVLRTGFFHKFRKTASAFGDAWLRFHDESAAMD